MNDDTLRAWLTSIRECEDLARHAKDQGIRETSAKLADKYRQLLETAKRREAA